MAIRLWWDTNITLINTSFTVVDGGYPPMVVSLFTAASAWNYHFEWDLLDSGNIAVSISINSTPKEIWSYYDGVTHHVTYEFTLAVWDIVTLEAAWNWTGSNLTVTRYADNPKEIFVWEWTPVDDYSAMRGPCPKGYHVPSNDEWVALYNAWINLWARTSSVWAPVSTYLKMPTAWYRYFQTSDPWGTEYWDYWSCTLSSRSANNFWFSLNGIINPTWGSSCTNWLSIRPFKDVPVVPDNTWTTLYTSDAFPGSRNIKHSQSLWLITISYDWTYITIADKNLWATTVYNSWNTLSEANCGKFYQRWNNYWFPWTWTVTTSSTQVDTTWYWPWNYYSSSTFITSGTFPYDWSTTKNANLRWWETWMVIKHIWNVKEVYVGTTKVWPEEKWDYYYSDDSFNEYQSLVDSVGSVQFVDTWRRFRFNDWVYIWNRTALDFNWTTMRTINLDTLTMASSKSSSISGRVWYFWDNRILTRMWIADFDGNMITTFSTTYNSITPWLPWVVWANSWFDIYKWIVDWDNITFTKVGTWWTDQWAWWMFYWKLWAYLINNHDTSWSWYSSYIDPESWAITNFWAWSSQRWRIEMSVSWPDWKLYRKCRRTIWWWLMQKIWTWNEWIVWNSLSTSRNDYWNRWWKFLWNIVSWWMNSNNWTWNWYWSNNYFIATDWTLTKVQDNAFAYDTGISWHEWFIDENGRYYPLTYWWWSWVILKTDKTFTDLNWKNPYLWR